MYLYYNVIMLIELTEIEKYLRPAQRIMGIDLGSKNIGVSISDAALRVATPLTTIRSKKFTIDALEIDKLIIENNVGVIVLGWPLNMDGTISKKCQATRQWALNHTYRNTNAYFTFIDERLSTVAIEKELINKLDTSRDKRKQQIDKLAASFILQGALDFINNGD